MFEKAKRYATITKVFFKYNLFSLLYIDILRDYRSHKKLTSSVNSENRGNAVKVRLAFEELGPTFIKLGQTLSKRSDLLPPVYIRELEKLQSEVKPLDFEKMRESFETECTCRTSKGEHGHNPICYHCNDILDIFDDFDTNPFASASIGQVYKGILKGKKVAVKIARPNVTDTINLDLAIIHDMKPVLVKIIGLGENFNFDAFLYEFREMLHRELDYRFEAINMKRMRENFKDVKDVIIPDSYMEYCRENILVMDYIEGTQIKDLVNIGQETKSRYAQLIGSSYLKQVYLDGFYHADPNSGNIIAQQRSIAFIDFGEVGIIHGELKRNMLNFFYAIYKKKVDMATDSFLKICNLSAEDVDIHKFKRDMDDLIADQHYGSSGRKSDRYAVLALKYDMSLPAEFSTLERAILLNEGVCLKLDPDYNIMNEAKTFMYKAIKERYSPGKVIEDFQFEADEYANTLKNIPIGIDDVIKTIRGYRIEKLQGKGDIIKKYRFLDEMSKNIFLAVMVITSVYLIIKGEGNIALLGIFGFASGILVGLYSIIRS